MKRSNRQLLPLFLIGLFNLGLFLQPVKAQIDSLNPVWVNHWKGLSTVGSAPCNAWDVHVYGDKVYATGIKTDNFWFKRAPLVLNAYSLGGATVWEKTWAGYSGTYGTGGAGSVLLGHGGYLYLGGAVSSDSMNASLIQKWDLNGNLIWTHHWGDETSGGHHEVNGLAIVGNYLYVSHYSAASGFETADGHIKKFNLCALNAGSSWSAALLWDKEYGQAGTLTTTDGHIYADQSGVYVCGQTGGEAGIHPYQYGDSYLKKFSPQGDLLWTQMYTGNGTGLDNAFNLKSDGTHIYLTGPTVTSVNPWLGFPFGLETQVFVQKYTIEGTLVWTKLFGGPKTEYSRGLEVDENYIYVGASTKSYVDSEAGGKDNTLLLTIDKGSGNLVSQRIWGGLGIDNANSSIDQDEYGSLYLSGYTTSADDGANSGKKRAVVVKVNKSDLVPSGKMQRSEERMSISVYPNPFSTETTLRTDRLLSGATLTILNTSGQAVKEIHNLSGRTITISRDNLPAGLFIIRLVQDDKVVASGKIMVQ